MLEQRPQEAPPGLGLQVVTKRQATLFAGMGKLAFSPRLAHTAANGTVQVLAVDIDNLIELAQSRSTRPWTPAECETYLQRDTCPGT